MVDFAKLRRGRSEVIPLGGQRAQQEPNEAPQEPWKPEEDKPLQGVVRTSVEEPNPEKRESERRDSSSMSSAFERILSRTFSIDPLALADELEGQLAIPDAERVEYGDLAKRAGMASENARKAHLLYVNAEAALAEFEARVKTTMAALRARAHESLATAEAEGKLGKKKTITNDDVESEMARIAPDEFERVEIKRARVKLMVEQLKREAELHRHFPHTIEALLSTSRSP